MELNQTQSEGATLGGSVFLRGPAGTGKTTTLHHRLIRLLQAREPAYTILFMVAELPQRDAALDAVHAAGVGPYADLKITTFPSLAREMVTLFWPLVARPAGFDRPYEPPTVLGYDLAQLLMWTQVEQALQEGTFADLRLRPQQIVSQILDTLNRAALNRLTLSEAIERQIGTWTGEAEHLRHLRQVEEVAQRFRSACFDNNLLDMSLITQVFDRHLVEHSEFFRYFSERFRHLLVDNVEEQTPAGQHFIRTLLNATVSTTLAFDQGGGYKRFLSADPQLAARFADECESIVDFTESFVSPGPLAALANLVDRYLIGETGPVEDASEAIWATIDGRYRRDMIDNLVIYLRQLLDAEDSDLAPSDIALVAPYLDGALRYALTRALKTAGIPYYILKRRATPREEPRIRAWLTWLALANPDWGIAPSQYDVSEALSLSIFGLDPARAALLSEALYRPEIPGLLPANELPDDVRERVGVEMVALVDDLRQWLLNEGGQDPVDTFLYRLYNELLAQESYRPVPGEAAAAICDWLVQTAGRLREAGPSIGLTDESEIGVALINGINQGLVTADPPDLGDPPDPNGVMISTTYGYLLSEARAHVQVWLETAATGWWDIPRQPLSNVFVLAESWPAQRLWTAEEEMNVRNRLLSQVVRGLTGRCTGGIILANNELDRRGQMQDGQLWRALQFVR